MKHLVLDFWADERGFVLSAELIILATTLVLGLTVSLVAIRQSIAGEMNDLAAAFRGLDQSYYYSGMRGHQQGRGWSSWTAGSSYFDPTLRTSGPQQELGPDDHIVGTITLPDGRVAYPPQYSSESIPWGWFSPGVASPAPHPQNLPVLPAPSAPCTNCPSSGTVPPAPSPQPPVVFPAAPNSPPGSGLPWAPIPAPKAPAGPLQVW